MASVPSSNYSKELTDTPQNEVTMEAVVAYRSEQVTGLDPLTDPTSELGGGHESREANVLTERTRQLSIQPQGFPQDEKVDNNSELVVAVRLPEQQATHPRRSDSGSSAESYEEDLKKELATAESDDKKHAICKKYVKQQRMKERQTWKGRYESLEHEKLILQHQLDLSREQCQKLTALLDANSEEKDDLRAKIRYLEKLRLVLQEALKFARRGKEIPPSIHFDLINLGCTEALEQDSEVDIQPLEAVTPTNRAQGRMCPFSSLNNHDFYHLLKTNSTQMHGTVCLGCIQPIGRINSHPYGEAILLASAKFILNKPNEDLRREELFWRGDHRHRKNPVVTAHQCTYPQPREAFCEKCDNSTSQWEREFVDNLNTGQLSDIRNANILVQTFRGALMNVDIEHYMKCQHCSTHLNVVGNIMKDLYHLHQAVCAKQDSDISRWCENLKPYMVHLTTFEHNRRIMYPVVVHVDRIGTLLYAQIPPYYWAVPAQDCRALSEEKGRDLVYSMMEHVAKVADERFEANDEWMSFQPAPVLFYPFLPNCFFYMSLPETDGTD